MIFYNYVQLLAFRFCKLEPRTVIMDGTSIAFRKELDVWKDILNTDPVLKIFLNLLKEDKYIT